MSEAEAVEIVPVEPGELDDESAGELWVAVDIGCIECGEDSLVLGVFTDRTTAKSAAIAAENIQRNDWHGQHSFEVFRVPGVNIPVPYDSASSSPEVVWDMRKEVESDWNQGFADRIAGMPSLLSALHEAVHGDGEAAEPDVLLS